MTNKIKRHRAARTIMREIEAIDTRSKVWDTCGVPSRQLGSGYSLSSDTQPSLIYGSTTSGRVTRYKAKIDFVSPLSRRTSFLDYDACFLGVSLENSKFTTQKLEGIVEWISRRFSRCTVLIGDSIHRITLESARALSPSVAHTEALRLGSAFLRDQRHVFDMFREQTQFTFLRCVDVQRWESYTENHMRLLRFFESDSAFRTSVEAFSGGYHDRKFGKLTDEQRQRFMRMSSEYFLEEFAIFACLKQRGLSVMVYPGSFSTLTEITNGQHPEAPNELCELTVVSLVLRKR